jgi:Spy/CpxP family protein refolding chaperone
MARTVICVSTAMALSLCTASAQSHQPYAGLQEGYPGPMHVLELADPLGLSAEQRAKMQELFAAMKAEAVPLGEQLIAQEADLDKQFADKTMTPARLEASTNAIGATTGALRRAHLKYHLSTLDMLTPAQAQRYAELRGYKARMRHPHGRH